MAAFWTQYPPFLPIFASSLGHHVLWSKDNSMMVADAAISICLTRVPPFSILFLWRHAIGFAKLWTKIPGIEIISPRWAIKGGPLGSGCGKVLEVLTGCVLWRIAYPADPLPLKVGQLPSMLTWVVVLGLSGVTNLALSLWSKQMQSRGNHSGVNSMVESSRGKELSHQKNLELVAWATVNAVCEEVASRGFWMAELKERGQLSSMDANILQALSFGIWHYNGIPSGWTGVGLTFVYGIVMGALFEYGQGLLLPIVAHSIADYFIFAVIAR